MQTWQKFRLIVRVILATILLCVAFIRPVSSQTSPDQPYDVYLPLLSKQYSPLPEIKNGHFELGNNGDWIESSSSGYNLIGRSISITPVPHSGEWLAWLGGIFDEHASLTQAVTLPADGPVYLEYYYQISSEKSACNADSMRLLVDMAELKSRGLCSAANTEEWITDTVALSAYAGQTITIEFEVTTDSSEVTSSFFLDDVSLSRSP
jgi:thermitase